MTFYGILLILHSLVRWVVVIAGAVAIVRAVAGWLGSRSWEPLDNRLGLVFTSALDTQLLLGVVLYVISPLIQRIFANFGAAMGTTELRFFAMEHALMALLAVVLAHVGRVRVRRAPDAEGKHKQAALFFGAAFLLILLLIPWPFMPYGRALLRLG